MAATLPDNDATMDPAFSTGLTCTCRARDLREKALHEEVDKLKRQLGQQTERFRAQVQVVQDKAAEHEEKARQHARNLSQQVFALRRSEQMLRAELEQTQRQKLEIERVFNIEMSAMDAKLGQATSASAQHLHEVTALQRKNNDLQKQLEAAQQRAHTIMDEGNQAVDMWKTKVDAVVSDASASRDKLAASRAEQARLSELNADLQNRLSQTTADLQAERSRNSQLDAEVVALQKTVDQNDVARTLLQKQVRQQEQRLAVMDGLERELAEARQKAEHQVEQIRTIRERNEAGLKREQHLQDQVDSLTRTVDMAQQQADAKDVAEQALARSQADYRELVCRGHQLETRLAKSQECIAALEALRDADAKHVARLEEVVDRVDVPCRSVRRSTMEDVAARCIATLQRTETHRQHLEDEVAELRTAMNEFKSDNDRLRDESAEHARQAKELQQQARQRQDDLRALQARFNQQRTALLGSERSIQEHIASVSGVIRVADPATLPSVLQAVQDAVHDLNNRIKHERTTRLAAEAAHSRALSDLQACRVQNDEKLLDIREQIQKALHDAEQRLDAATSATNRALDACRVLYRAYVPMRHRVHALVFQKRVVCSRLRVLEVLHERVQQLALAMSTPEHHLPTTIVRGPVPRRHPRTRWHIAISTVVAARRFAKLQRVHEFVTDEELRVSALLRDERDPRPAGAVLHRVLAHFDAHEDRRCECDLWRCFVPMTGQRQRDAFVAGADDALSVIQASAVTIVRRMKQLKRHNDEMDRRRSQHDGVAEQLRKERDQAELALRKSNDLVKFLETRIHELQSESMTMITSERHDEAWREMTALRVRHDDLQRENSRLQAQIATLQRTNDDLRLHIEKVDRELKAKFAEIASLEQAMQSDRTLADNKKDADSLHIIRNHVQQLEKLMMDTIEDGAVEASKTELRSTESTANALSESLSRSFVDL